MADDALADIRTVLNLPLGEIETVFIGDKSAVVSGKIVGPMPEFGTNQRGARPYLLGKRP